MLGDDAGRYAESSHWPPGGGPEPRPLGAAIAIASRAMTGGTLAIRLLATGILLVVGLPVLTVFLYLLGYPATPVPLPLVIVVDGLQLLIVAYAAVITVQLVAYVAAVATGYGRSTPRSMPGAWDEATAGAMSGSTTAPSSRGWAVLRDESLRLADLMWLEEQRGRPEFGPAALAYVRDAVMLELEYRRRRADLQRRVAELEVWAAQDSVVASERM